LAGGKSVGVKLLMQKVGWTSAAIRAESGVTVSTARLSVRRAKNIRPPDVALAVLFAGSGPRGIRSAEQTTRREARSRVAAIESLKARIIHKSAERSTGIFFGFASLLSMSEQCRNTGAVFRFLPHFRWLACGLRGLKRFAVSTILRNTSTGFALE
jgi:hypothetical protein